MRPIGPDTLYTDCLLIVGVSRSKLAAVFLTVMILSLFLTFHGIYDSSLYNIKSPRTVSKNRLTLRNHVPDIGHQIIKTINHPVFLSNHVYFPKTSRKLPQALIIGVRKCGTRALLEMLYLHPRIQKAGGEVHFFDRDENYIKGLEWYRKKMPYSFRGQITIEKSPSYFVSSEVPERVRAMNASIKLLLIVREPVTRAISDYTQLRSHATLSFSSSVNQQQTTQLQYKQQLYSSQRNQQSSLFSAPTSPLSSFISKHMEDNDFNKIESNTYQKIIMNNNKKIEITTKGNTANEIIEKNVNNLAENGNRETSSLSLSTSAVSSSSKSFEELAIFPNGSVNESYRPLTISMYHLHVHRWLEVFPREQLLIVNGDQLIEDPVSQLKRIEKFLGIEHRINSNHFYFNETKGFYCLRYDNGDRCLRETKGRKHPYVDPIVISKLRKFFAEHNQKFYELVREDLGWPEE